MTCGEQQHCNLCQLPHGHSTLMQFPYQLPPFAYEAQGNLTAEMKSGRPSRVPKVQLCSGCLARVLEQDEEISLTVERAE